MEWWSNKLKMLVFLKNPRITSLSHRRRQIDFSPISLASIVLIVVSLKFDLCNFFSFFFEDLKEFVHRDLLDIAYLSTATTAAGNFQIISEYCFCVLPPDFALKLRITRNKFNTNISGNASSGTNLENKGSVRKWQKGCISCKNRIFYLIFVSF